MKNDSVTVRADAVEWLKTHYPTLCEKSGLCERVGGRLYTRTFLATPKEAGSQPTATKGEGDFEAAWAASGFTKFKETGRAMWEAALANRPTADVWPIARLVVVETESGNSTRIEQATFYAPGLPAGTHDVYPVAGCCQPTAAGAVPKADMFWNHDDAERCRDSIFEVVNYEMENGGEVGNVIEIQQAIRLENIKVRVIQDPQDEDGFDYEVIGALAAPADGKAP